MTHRRGNTPRRACPGALLVLALCGIAAGPPERGSPTPATVRLATFNIHHGEGSDGTLDLKRVADVVRGADIVALQEVDVRFRARSRFVDQAAWLAKELGGHSAFGGNLIEGDGQYGVALISKFPILSQRNHRLPHAPGREKAEPRGLLEVELDVPGRPLRVFVTHLSHDSQPERLLQVARLREVIAAVTGEYVLMGDLNFRPDSEEYARLLAQGRNGEAVRDLPPFRDAWSLAGRGAGATINLKGRNPGRIDSILVSPGLNPEPNSARVDGDTVASDHQPVFVTLRVSGRR